MDFIPEGSILLNLGEEIIATTRPLIGLGFFRTVTKDVDILDIVEK